MDTVIALPARIPQMTHVRGTWIVASVASLRREGLLEAYSGLLPVALHEAILHAVPAAWLEIDLAMEHYRACDMREVANHATASGAVLRYAWV